MTYDGVARATKGHVTAASLHPVPTAPSGLIATAISQTRIDLEWTDNSDDETGFRIERSLNGTSLWMHIATVDADETSYSDTDLACGTEYYYQVCAVNDNGNSDYTDAASTETVACTVPQVIIELESPIP
jgi:fibronectin type 3 domain-containing protein